MPTMHTTNINTQFADRTCSMFFSWDILFYHAFFVSLYLLIFRLFFTFLFAFIFVQQWHVEKAWGWFPIVAFNSDIETFTKMNSYAIVLTSIAVLSLFIFQIFAHYQSQRMYKIYAWYLGVVMLLVQYAILIYINALVRFSISTDLWLIFVGIILFATFMLYLWWRFIRQWKFRQYFKKSIAVRTKDEKKTNKIMAKLKKNLVKS
ncbi:MAG: hypothetical protein WC819_03680 [Parcubacteria group bacterium]